MQGRRTIKHDRVLTNNLFEDIPDFRDFALYQFLRCLDRGRQAAQLQLAENKRLEQLERHFLGKAALMKL